MMIKEALDFELYDKYEIDQRYKAYKIVFKDISVARASEIEDELIQQKFSVINSEIKRTNQDKFDLKIIAVEAMSFTF